MKVLKNKILEIIVMWDECKKDEPNDKVFESSCQDHQADDLMKLFNQESSKQLGKLGGQATSAKYGKDHFKRIAKGWPKGKPRKPKEVIINSHKETP